ncbi:MAG: hypothetical protein AABW80_00610 [Nanoarchaeota archaeon]
MNNQSYSESARAVGAVYQGRRNKIDISERPEVRFNVDIVHVMGFRSFSFQDYNLQIRSNPRFRGRVQLRGR